MKIALLLVLLGFVIVHTRHLNDITLDRSMDLDESQVMRSHLIGKRDALPPPGVALRKHQLTWSQLDESNVMRSHLIGKRDAKPPTGRERKLTWPR